ncbi:MAG TPA: glycosyltransferase family 2 protein [Solirubrobacteraceae bacterium]|nr:glycosyltransferase family 2 protein [Solirubrobacteraceae bacterium]
MSVVIPTTGRATVTRAVASALEQTRAPLEVIVVFDLEVVPPGPALPAGVQVLCTGGWRGGNGARMMGITAASGTAIALLDDDDYWYPAKLAEQVDLLEQLHRRGSRGIVGCGLDFVREGEVAYTGPRRFILPEQRVADYLFKRRQVRDGGASLHTSALLIDRELLFEEPLHGWDIHEDWDWVLRAERLPRVAFAAVPRPLFVYQLPAPGVAMSRSHLWRRSAEWVESYRSVLTPREYGDFLASVTVTLAIDAGDRAGALAMLLRALRRGRPGPQALLMAAGLLVLPRQGTYRLRRLVDRLMG